MQTEVDLLRHAITAERCTDAAFAEKLGMTRQNLNLIIRAAEKKGGKLNPKFLEKLKLMYNIDIYIWKRNPTLDFYSTHELQSSVAAEPVTAYGENKALNQLIDDKVELLVKLKECEKEKGEFKSQLEAHGLLQKKDSPRRSALRG